MEYIGVSIYSVRRYEMDIQLLDRRERIIIATIQVINDVGIQKLSTKLIAKYDGVSEGTLFRHFKSKTEIMLAVLEHFSQYDQDIIQTSRNKNLAPVETIKYFINTYAEYYENYPEITAIMQSYDSLLCDSELAGTVERIVNTRTNYLFETLKQAQSRGMIHAELDCENLVNLILGGFKETCLKWRMRQYNFGLRDKVVAMIDMLLTRFIVN